MNDLTGVKISSVEPGESKKTIDLTIQFPYGTILQPTEGDKLIVNSATAVCFIKSTIISIDTLEYLSLGETVRAAYADFELLGHKGNVTFTKESTKPNELGICFYLEGSTVSGISEKPEFKLISGEEVNDINATKIYLKERN